MEGATVVNEVERFKFSYLSPADKPVIPEFEVHEIVWAKEQPEYIPLRALVSHTPERRSLSRWTLTDEQRKFIADGGDIYLELSTFGKPLQPIRLAVGTEINLKYISELYRFAMPKEPEGK